MREHMESENRLDFDTTMSTFHHPRYELIATGDVHDGEGEVARYFEESRAAFPDQRNELIALHHADDAVVVEFDLKGTHLGSFRGLPPTGRAFTCRMAALFLFDEDRLVVRARLLRLGHDPAPARHRARPADVARADRDRAEPSRDGRPGRRAGHHRSLSAARAKFARGARRFAPTMALHAPPRVIRSNWWTRYFDSLPLP